jgi:hypothetical protein
MMNLPAVNIDISGGDGWPEKRKSLRADKVGVNI